ncbi:TPA: hypothetical protein ACH3X1_007798 [Trebouxia sp. C0004]
MLVAFQYTSGAPDKDGNPTVQSANTRAHRICSGCQEILKSCTVVTGIAHLKACGNAKQKHPGMLSALEHNKVRKLEKKEAGSRFKREAEGQSTLVFGHKSAVHIISKCQKLVTSSESQIESSHKLKHWVHEEYVTVKKSSPQHKKLAWLVQAATTRFSSTYNGMLSIQQMEVAFKNMADKDGAEIKRHCLSKGCAGDHQRQEVLARP